MLFFLSAPMKAEMKNRKVSREEMRILKENKMANGDAGEERKYKKCESLMK